MCRNSLRRLKFKDYCRGDGGDIVENASQRQAREDGIQWNEEEVGGTKIL